MRQHLSLRLRLLDGFTRCDGPQVEPPWHPLALAPIRDRRLESERLVAKPVADGQRPSQLRKRQSRLMAMDRNPSDWVCIKHFY